MLSGGVFDITWAIPAYTPGKFPDRGLFELPGLFKDAHEASATIWRMYEKGLLPGYEELHPLAFGGVSPYGIHSGKKIESIDDLRGLKIRAGGPVHSATIKALGATPIGMPITSAAESLSRGVLDAAETEWFGVKAFRFYDVTKYHFELSLGSNYAVLTMDKKRFDSLPANAREALDSLGGEKLSRQFGMLHLNLAKAIRGAAEKDPGHYVVYPSDADLKKLAAVQRSVIDDWAAKTPSGAKMLSDLRAVLKDVRAGQ
jgi:TRAP-type C4-dicarboxylate transport system substrate-binding protein